MSGKQLRSEYQRLTREIADALANKGAEGPDAWQLLERLRGFTEQCVERIAETEAQIADLKRKIFGPRADRLTPQQEQQLQNVIDDMEAEAKRAAPDSEQVLSQDDPVKPQPQKPASRRRHPVPRIWKPKPSSSSRMWRGAPAVATCLIVSAKK